MPTLLNMPSIVQISYPKYRIEFPDCDSPYHGLIFTEQIHGKDWLDLLQQVQGRDCTLPSAQEWAAFQIVSRIMRGAPYQWEDGLTRTVAVYFKDGQNTYVAFDDTSDPQQNILLKRIEEANRVYAFQREELGKKPDPDWHEKVQWRLPKTDRDISTLLSRAERDGRICDLGEYSFDDFHRGGHQYLKLSPSQWGNHSLVNAVLGDCAVDFPSLVFTNGGRGLLQAPFTGPLETLKAKDVAVYGVAFHSPYSERKGIDLAAQSWLRKGTRGIKNPKEWTKAL